MLALALGGQRAAALRQYDACRSVLAQELGVAPSAETEALKRQIRDAKITAIGSSGPPAQAGRLESSSVPCAPSPEVFVARDRELARLGRFLDLALAGQWGDITVDLDEANGRHFVDALLDCEPNRLGEAFRERLARHTEGHALFTVELLRAFQERGELLRDAEGRWVEGTALPAQCLPPRVEAVIAERVGWLPRDWRHVLDAAAVEGESFSAEVVARALDVEASWVCDLLSGPLSAESKLVQSLGVQRLFEGGKSLSRYRFAHALFQEYLDGQLDAVERARLHEAIGRALEAIYADSERPAGLAAILAWHYEAAGMSLQAAHAVHDASHQAVRLSAPRHF